MQGTFIGFNTAGITFEERFLALLLKVKKENGFCEIYYLQAPVLADLLLILQSRMAVIFQRLENQGEAYKDELITYNEALLPIFLRLRRLKYSNHPLSGESCPLRSNLAKHSQR